MHAAICIRLVGCRKWVDGSWCLAHERRHPRVLKQYIRMKLEKITYNVVCSKASRAKKNISVRATLLLPLLA